LVGWLASERLYLKNSTRFSHLRSLQYFLPHNLSARGVFQFDRTLDAENVGFFADPDLSYYGFITDSRKYDGARWIVRPLSLTAHMIDDLESPIAYFDHVLQPCDAENESSTSIEFDSQDKILEKGGMWSGGRQRPQQVDVELLRRWIRLCEEQHNSSCSLNSNQQKHAWWVPYHMPNESKLVRKCRLSTFVRDLDFPIANLQRSL
jgi:hypothetical protein